MDGWNGYLNRLASSSPVPGGGGASAVCGALGAALGEMVANLTTGKKKYEQWESRIQENLDKLTVARNRFMELSKEDELVFEPLSEAYRMKASTEEEKKCKEDHMEICLYNAAVVPLELMGECVRAMDSMEFLAAYGSRLAVSDVGVGIQFLKAALSGAVMNVYINTKLMKNRHQAEDLNRQAEWILKDGCKKADDIYQTVLEAVKK